MAVSASYWFYNNVAYGNAGYGFNFIAPTSPGTLTVTAKNNIASGNTTGQVSATNSSLLTLTADYNNAYGTTPYSGKWTQGAHDVTSNPLLTSSSDFHLQPTSPAINAGTTIAGLTSDYAGTSVPQGSAPDIGAYEFILPPAPSSLAQYKSDGTTSIASGGWTNETTAVLKFSMSSANSSDSLTPQVEIQPSGTSFTNTANNTGTAVAYSGSSVTGTVTVTGLTPGTTYHWQAQVSNSAGTSSWVAKGNNPDFGVDTTAPSVPGTPTTTTPTSNNKPTWTWSASSDSGSGLASPAYTLQWSQDSTFNTGVSSDTSNTASYTHSTSLSDGTWYFRVEASDVAGNSSSYSSNGSVTIDTSSPTVTDVTSTTTSGAYKAGATLNVRATFSKNVTLTGTPQIKLQTNNGNQYATYATGSGSPTIDFSYTVQAGDTTNHLDYVNTSALGLNGGTIQDSLGNNANLTLASPGATHSLSANTTLVLDTTAPSVPGTPSSTTPTSNNKPAWTWNASSDSGSGLASTPYTVQWCTNSSFTGCSANTDTSNTASYTNSTSLADGTWYFRVQASDVAGNSSSYSSNGSVVVDTTAPTGGSFTINSGATYTSSTSVTLNITCPTDSWTPVQMAYGSSLSH